MRLVKYLAHAGIASRRAAEEIIRDGRVTIGSDVVTDPARDVGDHSHVAVDGRPVRGAEERVVYALNKPRGVVSTAKDTHGRRTVVDLVNAKGGARLYPVGRLDADSTGLLLLTNDGDLAAMLTHPRHGVERSYEARVKGMPDDEALQRLRDGIPLDGHRTLPAEAELLNRGKRDRDGLVKLTITEGRNRQVRRMLEAVGHPVKDLMRTRIGSLTDKYLKPGRWRDLTDGEIRALKNLSRKAAGPRPTSGRRPSRPAAARPRAGSAR